MLRLYAMGVVSIRILENHPVREARTPLLRKEGSFIVLLPWSLTRLQRIYSLPQLLIHKSKDCGRDANDDESGDGTPDGVGLGELPDGEDAENGTGDERRGDHDECDPANDRRIHNTARLGLELYNNIGTLSLHTRDYSKLKIGPVCLANYVGRARLLRHCSFKLNNVLTPYVGESL